MRVLLFGDVKAAAGTSSINIRGPGGRAPSTARQILSALRGEVPDVALVTEAGAPFVPPAAWADLVRPAVLAVELEYVLPERLDDPVAPNAEVAIIPPISGG